MAGGGLIALIDDVSTILKNTALSTQTFGGKTVASHLDDVAKMTSQATGKATGIVTDDLAVTAERVNGISQDREIPVIREIAKGSLRNKFLYLIPGALILSAVAPQAIGPILTAGGAYLSHEGAEKVAETFNLLSHHEPESHEAHKPVTSLAEYEREQIDGAIRTDLVLSGEIVALTMGEIARAPLLKQALTLGGVSLVMTAGVYGLVAGLMRLDNWGQSLQQVEGDGMLPSSLRWLGEKLESSGPGLTKGISAIGTVAMLMVGGHILMHGLGLEALAHHAISTLGLPGLAETALNIVAETGLALTSGAATVRLVGSGIPAKLANSLKSVFTPAPASPGSPSVPDTPAEKPPEICPTRAMKSLTGSNSPTSGRTDTSRKPEKKKDYVA